MAYVKIAAAQNHPPARFPTGTARHIGFIILIVAAHYSPDWTFPQGTQKHIIMVEWEEPNDR